MGKSNLPYTNAVLQESLRMATITPMALPHFTTEDLEVRGYTIPKNSTIIADILNVHYNPNHWKDPEIFNPGRFYENATILSRMMTISFRFLLEKDIVLDNL